MCWIRYGRSLRQNEMKKDKNIILDNFIWRFAERCGAQLVTAVVTLLLARILVPEDYGRTALVAVFINILQVFIDSGLGTALIQKKDADDLDFSSVFYFNFAVCLVLYAGMFIAAPYIAAFYKDPSLTPVVRVASLTLVFSGLCVPQYDVQTLFLCNAGRYAVLRISGAWHGLCRLWRLGAGGTAAFQHGH